MAFSSRLPFRTIRGGITFTGNTLGLAKAENNSGAGSYHMIGAFINADSPYRVMTYPVGTTLDYTQNKSKAELVLPTDATVVYAEVIWAGNSRTSTQTVLARINDSILFVDAKNNAYYLSPNNDTKFVGIAVGNSYSVSSEYYVRSCVVTDIVREAGAGMYTVGRVPGIIDATVAGGNATNFAGWTLAVVYEDLTMPVRSVALHVGGQIVSLSAGVDVKIPISDFSTPSVGPLNARILISAAEGDLHLPGDTAAFAPTEAELDMHKLSGPRNPIDNFFASQITDDKGNLDQSGTFGALNQGGNNTNIQPTLYVNAARQGWDIMNVDASSHIKYNQTNAVFRATTKSVPGNAGSGDAYMPVAIGIQIDILDANIEVTKTADKSIVILNTPPDTVTYTIKVENKGLLPVTGVVLKDPLPQGMQGVVGSVTVDGVSAGSTADITKGIGLGTIGANQAKLVKFRVQVVAAGVGYKYINKSNVTYTFVPAVGISPVTTTKVSNSCEVGLSLVVIEKKMVPAQGVSGDTVLCVLTVKAFTSTSQNKIRDTLPEGTRRTDNYVKIGNNPPQIGDIEQGVEIGSLSAGGLQTISFNVKIL